LPDFCNNSPVYVQQGFCLQQKVYLLLRWGWGSQKRRL